MHRILNSRIPSRMHHHFAIPLRPLHVRQMRSFSCFAPNLFDKRVVLVTGGSKGIGYEIARLYAQHGATVAICSRQLENARSAIERIRAECTTPANHLAIECDVSKEDAVHQAVSMVVKECTKIDILINCAGISQDGLLMRTSTTSFMDHWNTNTLGCFLMTQAVSKEMMRQSRLSSTQNLNSEFASNIINIGSVVGVMGNVGQVAYATSKSALIGLTRTSARELARYSIRVNLIQPGWIKTDMTKKFWDRTNETTTTKENKGPKLSHLALVPRIGTPSDVATTALFLTSDAASYITGQIINVDGGLSVGTMTNT